MPLLNHGCAELASAQYTIPAKRVFHQLMVLRSSMDVYREKCPCRPDSCAVPLLRHGYAELATGAAHESLGAGFFHPADRAAKR